MNDKDKDIVTYPAPVLDLPIRYANGPVRRDYTPDPKWLREYEAFERMKPRLLEKYRDKYVAIDDGQVVGVGDDQTALAFQVYSQRGYHAIHVGLVTDKPERPLRSGVLRVREAVPNNGP